MSKKNQLTRRVRVVASSLVGLTVACSMAMTPALAANAAMPRTAVTDMTTNYMTNPIGVEDDGVRLAWRMSSNVVGAGQKTYAVNVTNAAGGKVWNSGTVQSGTSTGIEVPADKLAEGASYNWNVTVTDNDGKTVTSPTASFETAVSDLPQWQDAQWIRLNSSTAAPFFRTEHQLADNKTVKSARLYITALGVYQAWVNGRQVGVTTSEVGKATTEYHHMNPGYGNGNVSRTYQTYDVTSALDGQSVAAIGVEGGTGWYNGMGKTKSQPAVKALLAVKYNDGTVEYVPTDTNTWKGTLDGPVTSNGVYYGEDYDARLSGNVADFSKPGFDDSEWIGVAEEESATSSVPVIANNFSQQTARYVRLSVSATGPAVKSDKENRLQIMEAELLDGDGKNLLAGLTATASDTFDYGDQWSVKNLTDGDNGKDSGHGYTSNIKGNGQAGLTLSAPITLDFDLGEAKAFSALKLYPRTGTAAVSGKECVNYPKTYRLQISEDGKTWTNVTLEGANGAYDAASGWTVDALRDTVLYPNNSVASETKLNESAEGRYVKVEVNETGPAVKDDNENRLQIMELEVLDDQAANVVAGMVPTVNDMAVNNNQWKPSNMTDGDNGVDSDKGWTSDILDRGQTAATLSKPIAITFDLGASEQLSSVRLTARTGKDPIAGNDCVNYAKAYTVSVSDDGEHWTKVGEESLKNLYNSVRYGAKEMTTTTYKGELRADMSSVGRLATKYDKRPKSITLYTGKKATSEFAGGEIAVDSEVTGLEATASTLKQGITLKKGQTMVVDMGQNMTAVPRFTFNAKAGTKLAISPGEMLNDGSAVGNGNTQADGPKGSVYRKNMRNARSQATYVFAGAKGGETYMPTTSFFGYQYLSLTATDDVTFTGVTSKALSSISEQTGSIVTNNKNVNQLFSNTLYGQLSNYFTTTSDCPQRDERLAWVGDTQAFAQTAVYNFDSAAFLSSFEDIMSENTMIKGYVPAVADQINGYFNNYAAGWSDAGVITAWTLWQQTGDATMISRNWEAMTHYMDWLSSNERGGSGSNLAPMIGGKNYGEWLSFQGTAVDLISDYYYGYVVSLMQQMAQAIGNKDAVAKYESKFNAIKTAFLKAHVTFNDGKLVINSGNKQYWTNQFQHNLNGGEKAGVWEDNSQAALLWMLKLGFYSSDDMRDAALTLLVDNIKNENPDPSSVRSKAAKNTLSVGFLGSNVITPVLSDVGRGDVSYDLLLQDEQPSWLFEVKAGATTVWERWNSYTPGKGFGDVEMNSFNHYAYGSVVEWMYTHMAGIAADQAGFKTITLQPTMDTGKAYNSEERIRSVQGSYRSYYGDITSSWKADNSGNLTSYSAVVPANTSATLYLPVDASAVDGDAELPDGVEYQGMTTHNGVKCAKFTLASGGWDFAMKDGKLAVALANGYVQADEGGDTPEPPASVDKSDLQTAVDEAKAEADASKYTADSWKTYQKALADAKGVLANDDATQDQVDAALKALQTAESWLKEAGSGETVDPDPGETEKPDPGETTKPTDSSGSEDAGDQDDKNQSGDKSDGESGDQSGKQDKSGDQSDDGSLSRTGAAVAALAGVAVLLAVAGVALTVLRKRRV